MEINKEIKNFERLSKELEELKKEYKKRFE